MARGVTAGTMRAVAGVAATVAVIVALVVVFGGGLGGGHPAGAGGTHAPSAAGQPAAAAGQPAATAGDQTAATPGTRAGDAPSGAGSRAARSPGAATRPAPRHADPLAGMAGYLAQRAGTTLAAVYDIRTEQTWRLGDGRPQDEASVVKLDILQALLAASGGSGLPPAQAYLARRMIEESDNDAATALWYAAGGTRGLTAYNARAGLRRTTLSSCVTCAGFPWPGWGLTTTVPADQLTLLKRLIKPSRLLSAAGRRYALSLMENVAPGQAWGISGGVPAGVTVALKNGWLPLNAASTDWQVNSVGWVHGGGRDYLIAVLSTGNPTERYGIDTISALSARVWAALLDLGRSVRADSTGTGGGGNGPRRGSTGR